MPLRLILWVVLLAIAVIFVTQNAQAVEVRFLVWRLAVSQALLLFFVLAVGFGVGWISRAYLAWRRARGADNAASGRAADRAGPID
ncbi:MAG: hypothetical protein A3G25_16300 [Betaproteobacteria bacterium RIFCSPLOWO2_12_FULL_63_13]|nr:MAG: hypothetical protein A3G25_16300 [Betaproteobacteria bacterium RIFCSPLOWO2_12_FULL_63_13]